MRVFLVNLLPSDVRERARTHGERRRIGLLVVLLACSLVGVSLHSWDQARRARVVRDAALTSRDRMDDVDSELARLELERQRLGTFMDSYRSIALPMKLGDLLATIVNRLPPKATLTDLSLKVVARAAPAPTPAPGAAPAPPPAPGAPPQRQPQQRVLEIRLRGYAAGTSEVSAFERSLAATSPFAHVTLGENRSLETPDGNFQEFVITADVPLERAYGTVRESSPLVLDRTAGAATSEAYQP